MTVSDVRRFLMYDEGGWVLTYMARDLAPVTSLR